MSLPDDVREREGIVDATTFLRRTVRAIGLVWSGWRAPKRAEEIATDAADADADAAVTASLNRARKKAGIA